MRKLPPSADTDPADVLTLTHDEVDVLYFLAESFLDDNKGDRMTLGTAVREAYGRKVVQKLSKYLDINQRCGVTGIEDSTGDRPLCTRRPHEDDRHAVRDIHSMKLLRWRGDRSEEYFASLRSLPSS